MRYDISKNKDPEMPNLGKGTECIKILLSQASKDMHEPLVPMLFPLFSAHLGFAKINLTRSFGGKSVEKCLLECQNQPNKHQKSA